jgi:hypothetical protein
MLLNNAVRCKVSSEKCQILIWHRLAEPTKKSLWAIASPRQISFDERNIIEKFFRWASPQTPKSIVKVERPVTCTVPSQIPACGITAPGSSM